MSPEHPPDRLGMICPSCDSPSASRIYGNLRQEADGESWRTTTMIYLVRCDQCGEPAAVVREDYGALGLDHAVPVWPNNGRHLTRNLSASIPPELRKELTEAHACFEARAYKATAVLVRCTLEGFCQLHGVRERTLHQSLNKLEESGVIDKRLCEWARGLKELGNVGAHFTATEVSQEDAMDALSLAEALLDYVYVFTARFDGFKKRRLT